MVSINKHAQSKTIGPKIVAVTSPRPLIVQVQSLTQAQSMNQEYDQANDVTDIPNGEQLMVSILFTFRQTSLFSFPQR